MSGFVIHEADLPEKIGVSEKALRELRRRHLQEGVDWEKKERGAIMLTLAAATKLGASLGLSGDTLAGLALTMKEGMEEKKQAPTQIKFACFLRQPKNRKLVLARLDGETINVKLKKPRGFKAHQKIPVEHVHHNIWQMVRARTTDRTDGTEGRSEP